MSEEVAAPVVESGAVGGGAVKKQPLSKVRKTKSAKATKTGTGASLSAHPPTKQMVDAAIKSLKERGGSSLPAIKKYIGATYKCDAQKLAPFIKKYLKSAVASGKLIQTKGKGASGSFKLSVRAKQTAANPSAADKPKKEVKKVKSTSSSGAALPRKTKGKGAVSVKLAKIPKKAPARKPASLSSPTKAAAKNVVSASTAAEKKVKAAKTTKTMKGVKSGGVVKAKGKVAAATKPKAPKAKSAATVKSKKVASVATGAAAKKAVSAAGKK